MSWPVLTGSEITIYRLLFLVWPAVWIFGFALQLKKSLRITGVIVTLIPFLFYVYLFVTA
ncbi:MULTISPECIES: hypothetical protein [Evansella]|jgi:hypothetical protein|nr:MULTISPECIES: hypothetical protein [Evansella]UTR10457.1 hypothetical protein MM300_21740 [Evansella sp. LMS18]